MTVRILVSAHFLHLKISKIQNALSTQKIWIWSNERCLMLPWKRQAGSWVEKEKQNIWTNLSFKGGPWPGLADIIWHWWANISMLLLHLAFSNHTCHPSQLIQSNERQFLKLFPAQTVLRAWWFQQNFSKSSGLLETGSGNSYKNLRLYRDFLFYCADLPVLTLGCRKCKTNFIYSSSQILVQYGPILSNDKLNEQR